MTPFIWKDGRTEWRGDPPVGAQKMIVPVYPPKPADLRATSKWAPRPIEVYFHEALYRTGRRLLRAMVEFGTAPELALGVARALLERGHGDRL